MDYQLMSISENRTSQKYSKKELFLRTLWLYLGAPLFRFSFRTMFGWRRFILNLFGAKISPNVNIYNSVKITMPWNLEVGPWSAIGENAIIYNLGYIKIGQSVTISQNAHLCAGSHDYTDPAMELLKPPITIGDNTWVCADAFIGPDTILAKGTIVGARAVITKDTEEHGIYAGNPAKLIKKNIS